MNNILKESSYIILFLMFLLFLMLCGCARDVVNTNAFYQTNYGEDCLYPPHTDSYKNLLFCYQANQNKEHAQNKITNKLAKGEE